MGRASNSCPLGSSVSYLLYPNSQMEQGGGPCWCRLPNRAREGHASLGSGQYPRDNSIQIQRRLQVLGGERLVEADEGGVGFGSLLCVNIGRRMVERQTQQSLGKAPGQRSSGHLQRQTSPASGQRDPGPATPLPHPPGYRGCGPGPVPLQDADVHDPPIAVERLCAQQRLWPFHNRWAHHHFVRPGLVLRLSKFVDGRPTGIVCVRGLAPSPEDAPFHLAIGEPGMVSLPNRIAWPFICQALARRSKVGYSFRTP